MRHQVGLVGDEAYAPRRRIEPVVGERDENLKMSADDRPRSRARRDRRIVLEGQQVLDLFLPWRSVSA